uniref:DUF4276 family protein n=1 Tax=Candidatus Kentrum sp. DK TaxID=2126562 RepID=A0A450SBR3_9GAMM|nr:MAG: hypothetical protein BECKDK2373B_GA0170837_102541 [Candidatus Kentron sp. DK]
MSENLLIVESDNDRYFIEALIDYLNLPDVEVGHPICNVDEFECLDGISNLESRLTRLTFQIDKTGIKKLGIILDANKVGIDGRVGLINEALDAICSDVVLKAPNTLVKSAELEVEIACHILNISGFGELETLLKAIKSKKSPYADCLGSWRECLRAEGREVADKYFDTLWVNFYQRYDNCKMNESNAGRNCRGETGMKKDIWNFEHPALRDLKNFLRLFGN